MKSIRSRLALPAVLLLGLLTSACSDRLGLGYGDLEGRYSYDGSVDGAPFYYIDGEIRVRDQRGDEALVDIDWVMRDDRGTLIYRIRSDSPARAYVRDDYIRFDFEGWLDDGGRQIDFVLEHEGEVRGRTMVGYWDLHTDYYGTDSGTFRAVR
ncbi:MAG TPA: hypothetical protein VFU06_07890 [Longimicrobiales bacterium]|nr:hypothetical protein [Longimicrobiales bacterium]